MGNLIWVEVQISSLLIPHGKCGLDSSVGVGRAEDDAWEISFILIPPTQNTQDEIHGLDSEVGRAEDSLSSTG